MGTFQIFHIFMVSILQANSDLLIPALNFLTLHDHLNFIIFYCLVINSFDFYYLILNIIIFKHLNSVILIL
jgi:hypothetical protein